MSSAATGIAKPVNGFHPSMLGVFQLDSQGRALISFPIADLHHLSSSLSNRKLQFSANVTESLTGITLNGSASVQVYRQAVKLEYPSSNPKTFKPGLDYVAYVSSAFVTLFFQSLDV